MPDQPTSILMVLEATFPVHGGGGAESQVLTLGRRMLDKGMRVEVVVPMVEGGPQVAQETVEGLAVTRIGYPKVRLLGGLVMLLKLAYLLIARRHDYQVIHAHIAHNMAAVCALVGWLLGKRVLVKLTGMREMKGGILDAQPSLAACLRKAAIRRAKFVQATSSRMRQLLVERGFAPEQIVLLANGVDVDRFVGTRPDRSLRRRLCGGAQLVGIFVGRLAPEKGHDILLPAWAQAFGGRSDVKLLLVGDGEMKESLMSLAKGLEIEAQVIFAGHTDDVSPYLAIADFGLLTSHSEGLSNSLLEYMAAGLPVIGSRVSGTEDFIVPGETGWLFEPGQPDALAGCLGLADSAGMARRRRMGEQGRQGITASASLEAVTRRLIQYYGLAASRGTEPLQSPI